MLVASNLTTTPLYATHSCPLLCSPACPTHGEQPSHKVNWLSRDGQGAPPGGSTHRPARTCLLCCEWKMHATASKQCAWMTHCHCACSPQLVGCDHACAEVRSELRRRQGGEASQHSTAWHGTTVIGFFQHTRAIQGAITYWELSRHVVRRLHRMPGGGHSLIGPLAGWLCGSPHQPAASVNTHSPTCSAGKLSAWKGS